jgi:hypothetical protein
MLFPRLSVQVVASHVFFLNICRSRKARNTLLWMDDDCVSLSLVLRSRKKRNKTEKVCTRYCCETYQLEDWVLHKLLCTKPMRECGNLSRELGQLIGLIINTSDVTLVVEDFGASVVTVDRKSTRLYYEVNGQKHRQYIVTRFVTTTDQ